jgi:predicted esterase
MYTHFSSNCDTYISGILVMSGYLPGASKFKITPGLEGVPVMHCHGTADPVVSGYYMYVFVCIY